MKDVIKLKFLKTNFKAGDNWGQNFKNVLPIGDLLICGQVPKSGDCPPKMGTFGHFTQEIFLNFRLRAVIPDLLIPDGNWHYPEFRNETR